MRLLLEQYVFLQPLHINRMQHKVNFQAEFYFSETGGHTKVKEPSFPNYLAIAGGRIVDNFFY